MPLLRLSLILAVVATLANPLAAAELKTYDDAAFAAAQQAGERIVLHVTAPWCTTCKAQKPTVDALLADPANADLVLFDADFDSRKDVLRKFNLRQQSSFVAFAGQTETSRSVGVVDPAAITALFESTRVK